MIRREIVEAVMIVCREAVDHDNDVLQEAAENLITCLHITSTECVEAGASWAGVQLMARVISRESDRLDWLK